MSTKKSSPALQIWSHVFCRHFDPLPSKVQSDMLSKIDDLGERLGTFPHVRLTGRSEFKLRVGDWRVLYDFDAKAGRLYLLYVGHRREIYKRV
jgi:mRNA-degrading endonuclease RelE of RelBE toxin-antitoxin system